MNGKNYPPDEKSDPGAGAWRTEVRPTGESAVHCFLHVLHASSTGAKEAPPEVELSSSSGRHAKLALRFGNREVRIQFDKSGSPGGRIGFYRKGRKVLSEAFPKEIELDR